jgi:uncharacterized protein (TIGR00288 family)
MASPQENVSMAVFCDFENVALGVRDAKIDRFDIKPVLERLLLKGSIVVKKAYCDWDRYKTFKSSMHEASFELIEIPHVRQSGKNSADIRLVVDALDLCYTKSHVDTFVIVSGDSDFSPLVSKLRENAKKVIGVGVKNSTSDLLVANCDEFIFYDDLVRELSRASSKRDSGAHAKREGGAAGDERQQKTDSEDRKSKAIALAVETLDALVLERGESGKIWASVLKSAIKRRRPDFSETRYGFRAFGNLLEEAQARGLLEVGRDEKSGAYVSRTATVHPVGKAAEPEATAEEATAARSEETQARRGKGRRDARSGASKRKEAPQAPAVETTHEHGGGREAHAQADADTDAGQPATQEQAFAAHPAPDLLIEALHSAVQAAQRPDVPMASSSPEGVTGATETQPESSAQRDEAQPPRRSAPRRARKTSAKKPAAQPADQAAVAVEAQAPAEEPAGAAAAAKKSSRKKSSPRARAKAVAGDEG